MAWQNETQWRLKSSVRCQVTGGKTRGRSREETRATCLAPCTTGSVEPLFGNVYPYTRRETKQLNPISTRGCPRRCQIACEWQMPAKQHCRQARGAEPTISCP